jgi:predicted DNA-binding transcriptional regulator YafY
VKARKSQALLWMYERLLEKGSLTKEEYFAFFEVSGITYKRYVAELRAYLSNFHPERILFYDRRHRRYVIEREKIILSIHS